MKSAQVYISTDERGIAGLAKTLEELLGVAAAPGSDGYVFRLGRHHAVLVTNDCDYPDLKQFGAEFIIDAAGPDDELLRVARRAYGKLQQQGKYHLRLVWNSGNTLDEFHPATAAA